MYLAMTDTKINTLSIPATHKQKLKHVKKGNQLLCMMHNPQETFLTPFKPNNKIKDPLAYYGYLTSFASTDEEQFEEFNLELAFKSLGIRSTPNFWTRMTISHDSETSHLPPDGHSLKKFPATRARYESYANLQQGVMISTYTSSPEDQIFKNLVKGLTSENLIPLRRFSDVTWLQREAMVKQFGPRIKAAGGKVRELEHVFRHHVVDEESIEIFRLVAGLQGPEGLGKWPGKAYPIKELQALALLASPNAYGVAWLLGQHKDSMGKTRSVDLIRIFKRPEYDYDTEKEGTAQWCLYLHLADFQG